MWDDAIYNNRINARYGIVVAVKNDKRRDKNPPGQNFWPFEALFQSYRLVCKSQGVRLSTLQMIIRHCVVNSATKDAITQSAQQSTFSDEGPLGYKVYTKIDDGFYAILGSVNGNNTYKVLRDHKRALGYRVVEKIVVLPVATHLRDAENPSRTLLFTLSERRTPLRKVPERKFGIDRGDFPKSIKNMYEKRQYK